MTHKNISAWDFNLDRAFGSGVAEREAEWLADVFLPPMRWEHWLESTSHLIIGASGSGRTAVAQQMLAYANQAGRPFAFLWRPVPQAGAYRSWEQVARRLLRAGVEDLVARLMDWDWEASVPPLWAATLLHRLTLDVGGFPLREFVMQRYPPGLYPHVSQALEWIEAAPSPPDLTLNVTEAAQYLVVVAQAMGYSAVWALLDPPFEAAGEVTPLLQRIAEVLQWFDVRGWVFKWFLPEPFARVLEQSTVVVRRRMTVEYLEWARESMRDLVRVRLAWATEGQWTSLRDVVEDVTFEAWLEEYGQTNPRAWLTLLHPFVRRRVQQDRPLQRSEWQEIARHYPPPLFLDLTAQVAYLGAKPVTLQRAAWRLLLHLYQHRDRLCERRALYYRAIEGVDEVPLDDRIDWRNTLDSALHRLREQLEGDLRQQIGADSKQALYVRTLRSKGVRLAHATPAFGLRALTR